MPRDDNRVNQSLGCWLPSKAFRRTCSVLHPIAPTAMHERNLPERCPWKKVATLVAIVTISMILLWNYSTVCTIARWLLWSGDYKSRVLAESTLENGELKHVEWDGWGWLGQYTSVYLVFDPNDWLSAARNHQPAKFPGIPCEVPSVRRLERHWYTVQFYSDTSWASCNRLGRTGTPDGR